MKQLATKRSIRELLGEERFERLKNVASGATVFGIPLADLDREELLCVIGLEHEQDRAQKEELGRRAAFEREVFGERTT